MLCDYGLSKQIKGDYADLSSKYGCETFISPEVKSHQFLKKKADIGELVAEYNSVKKNKVNAVK